MLAPFVLLSAATLAGMPLAANNHNVVQSRIVASASVSDTVANGDQEIALTEELLVKYIAVKKELKTFWKSHKSLRDSALATKHDFKVETAGQHVPAYVFDYPSLVKKDAALASLFKKKKLAPAQLEPVQRAVLTALVQIVAAKATGDSQTVAGKNIELVVAHREELRAVGIDATAQQKTSGGGGGGDDLNP